MTERPLERTRPAEPGWRRGWPRLEKGLAPGADLVLKLEVSSFFPLSLSKVTQIAPTLVAWEKVHRKGYWNAEEQL